MGTFHRKQASMVSTNANFVGNSVSAEFIGQIGLSSDTDAMYIAKGLNEWIPVSPSDANVEITSTNIAGAYDNLKALLDAMFDGNQKILSSFLPGSIVGGLKFAGVFASLEDITAAAKATGDVLIYSPALATDTLQVTCPVTSTVYTFSKGDFLVFGDVKPADGVVEYYKMDNTDVALVHDITGNYITPGTISAALNALDQAIADNAGEISTGQQTFADHVNGVAWKHDSEDIVYDNTISGLTAADVKAAIDEVAASIDSIEGNFQTKGSDYELKVYTAATEPTLDTDSSIAIWEDSANSTTFIVYRDAAGNQKGIEIG